MTKSKETRVEKITVTPPQAALWLAKYNIKNRPINSDRVALLVDQIKDGKWVLTNDAIGFEQGIDGEEEMGRMFNGQHRLTACVRSGEPIEVLVMYNADPKAFMVTDIGMKKTASHALATTGEQNSPALAALARVIAHMHLRGNASNAFYGSRSVPPNEIVAVIGAYPQLRQIADAASSIVRRKFPATSTVVGFCLFLADQVSLSVMNRMVTFLERTSSLARLEEDSPELALYRRLSTMGASTMVTSIEKTALIIKAFNAHVDDRKVSVLLWKSDEAFPTIEIPDAEGVTPTKKKRK